MYESILDNVGYTPLVKLQLEDIPDINVFAKLELYNPTGSVKDRAASYILKKVLASGEITKNTTIIESSSGNFGIALSAYCNKYGLKFCCVVDPNLTSANEVLMRRLKATVIKVTEPDSSGGYLLKRIEKVKEMLRDIPDSYWINQYGNPYNAEAYYNTLGNEICEEVNNIDYIFMGVSSCGTITGVSQKIKEVHPNAKVIAVDSVGSVIFGGLPKKRYIPGMGSSMVPENLKYAKIDEVVMVEEAEAILMCHQLVGNSSIFAGGSSGSVMAAVKKYFSGKSLKQKLNVAVIFADRGDRYSDTIYDDEWCKKLFEKHT